MPHWLIKSATQRAISGLPRSYYWNYLFQTYVTHSLDLTPADFENRLALCAQHLNHLLTLQPGMADAFRVLELGTGWFPTIPVGLHLCGAAELWTFDLYPLLRPEHIQLMLQRFLEYAETGRLQNFLPLVRPERVRNLGELLTFARTETPEAVLNRLDIHYKVQNAQRTGLRAGTIDFIFSCAVLEYIPRPALEGIMNEFRRVSSPQAVMSHRIVLQDQFASFDRNITEFNFLRFTERQWQWLNSPLIWQNRLRIADYRQLISAAGFEIVREENQMGESERLAQVPLAPQFRRYAKEDLLVLESLMAIRPIPAET